MKETFKEIMHNMKAVITFGDDNAALRPVMGWKHREK